MTASGPFDAEALGSRIGYRFKDTTLAEKAMTHVSSPSTHGGERGQSYQRLEFLGDRVLGLVVAALLYEAFPEASEGELSLRLARLVRRETCAEVAARLELGDFVRLGEGEAKAGGRKKAAILGDLCESLLGAVYLDGGIKPAAGLVETHWRALLNSSHGAERDSKTAMQEWAQARALPTPRYEEVKRSGPAHRPHFVVNVMVEGFDAEPGEAGSKRAAEQEAARAFLARWSAP
jgi:ribonuclease III